MEVAGATEPFDSSSYLGRAMRNLLGVFAEMEREMIAERRTREKMEASRRKGLFISGILPMGYVRGKDKLLQIEPKGAALIKRIFRDYASHGTTYSIADALNGEGISRSLRNGNKRLWTPMDIQRTLRNALYAGYIASGEELFEGQHKALISRAEWERVQTKLNSASSIVKQRVKRTRPRMVYSLSGLLRCTRCGKLMTGSYGMKGEALYKYYTCTTRKKYGERRCACPSLNAEQIEGFVKEQMMGLRNDEEFIAAVLSRPLPISKTTANSFSIPIHLGSADQGCMRKIRRRTVGDEMEKQAQTRACPSVRVIRMANAILLERILGTGQFKSPAALAAKLGISRSVVSELLNMLNLPVAEIERILFETR